MSRFTIKKYWHKWLDKRIPPTSSITLAHRSIFILPSSSGGMFALLLVLLLVTAINYQNSLIYALMFWLFSIGLTAMLLTFRNLSGLTLTSAQPKASFVGDKMDLPIWLKASTRTHEAIQIGFHKNDGELIRITPERNEVVLLPFKPEKRGPLSVERIRLDSCFPLGIFNAWSWIRLEFKGVIYPKPEFIPFVFVNGIDGDELEGAPSQEVGQNDFYGLRPYQAGDSLKRIAWKQLARGKGLVTKEFDHDEGASCWLDWTALAPQLVEMRLSHLCGWVLEAHKQGWRYGLRLPGTQIEPNHSEHHLEQCLTALALFGFEGVQ